MADTPAKLLPPTRARLIVALAAILLASTGTATAQTALPYDQNGIGIVGSNEVVITVDLGDIPNRPHLYVDVVPLNAFVSIEIEINGWTGLGPCVGEFGEPPAAWADDYRTFLSTPNVGANSAIAYLTWCEPRVDTGYWDNGTVDVTIRVTDWAGHIQFTQLDVSIYGVTDIPTNEFFEEVDTTPSPTSRSFTATRDTVLYSSNSAASNGAGDSLWAGHDHAQVGFPPNTFSIRMPLHSLVAFDTILEQLPIGSVITSANVDLYATSILGGGGTVSLHDIAPHPSSSEPWLEGSAQGSGSEFTGAISATPAADWIDRRGTVAPWTSGGGDAVLPALSSQLITTTGAKVFTGVAIADSIQDAVDTRAPHEGFVLEGPGALAFLDTGVQFSSASGPNFIERPRLDVDYVPPPNVTFGNITTGTVTYIGEGENFRWVYDNDDDGLLQTPVGGVCEALPGNPGDGTVNDYHYSYQGAPGYVGTDCCAWWVDAPQTGVLGTGQVIFFHNLDPTNPANLPPDTDGDGMRDGCDNCVNVPNGPYLGTCVGLAGAGGTCTADTDCGQYEYCSQSQEDLDRDQTGDACAVPEPGFGAMLGVSISCLAAVARRRQAGRAAHARDDMLLCRSC